MSLTITGCVTAAPIAIMVLMREAATMVAFVSVGEAKHAHTGIR